MRSTERLIWTRVLAGAKTPETYYAWDYMWTRQGVAPLPDEPGDLYEIVWGGVAWAIFKNYLTWITVCEDLIDAMMMCNAEAIHPTLPSRVPRRCPRQEALRKKNEKLQIPLAFRQGAGYIPSFKFRSVPPVASVPAIGGNVSFQKWPGTNAKESLMATATAQPPKKGASPVSSKAPSKASPPAQPGKETPRGAIQSPKGSNPKEPKEPKETKAPKPRMSASEDEVKAAVEGTLQPRTIKGTRDQAGLGQEQTGNGRPLGRPIGLKWGLPIQMTWCYLFQENERRAAAFRKGDKKMKPWTDAQISEMIKAEFPGRPNSTFDAVNSCRNYYNKGQPTHNMIPKVQSQRYGDDGNPYVKPAAEPPKKAGSAAPTAQAGGSKGGKAQAPKPAGKNAPAPSQAASEEPEEPEDTEEPSDAEEPETADA